MMRVTLFVVLSTVALLGFAPAAQATLIGDTVNARVTNINGLEAINGSAVVSDPGVEFFGVFTIPSIRVDIGADTITLLQTLTTSLSLNESAVQFTWQISDLDFVGQPNHEIVDVQLIDSVNFTVSSLSFTADSVTFGPTTSSVNPGQPTAFASYRLITRDASATTAVPEPATAGLGLLGLMGLGMAITRRRSPRTT